MFLVAVLLDALALPTLAPLVIRPALFPPADRYAPVTGAALAEYFARCVAARDVLPPPPLPFD